MRKFHTCKAKESPSPAKAAGITSASNTRLKAQEKQIKIQMKSKRIATQRFIM